MVTSSTLHGEERRAVILATVNREHRVQLDELATALGVSPMTVRRDLDDLEAEGLLRRVRGGAIALDGPRTFTERRAVRTRAKQAIAAKAAEFVPASGAIALDASSTVGTLASTINTQGGLLVATNSLENFTAIASNPELDAILLGGQRDVATGSLVGKLACDAAAAMLYRTFFTSAAAVHPLHGSTEASLAESHVKRTLMEQSDRTILCVDSSKLGSTALAATLSLTEVEVMITELNPTDPLLDAYRDNVEVR